MSNENNTISNTDEIDLRELIFALIKGWKLIILITLITTTLAFLYARSQPNQYVVHSKAATTGSGGSSQMLGLAAIAGINMSSGSQDIDLMQHIDMVIKKRSILDTLLKREWIIPQTTIENEQVRTRYDTVTLAQYWEIEPTDTTHPDWQYSYRQKLYNRLRSSKFKHLSVSKEANTLDIKTAFTNPQLAYDVHTLLLDVLKDYFKNDYMSRGRKKREFIEARVEEVLTALTTAETALLLHQEKNIRTIAPRVILKQERLKRKVLLQAELYGELLKQLEMAKIEEKKDTPIFEIFQDPERPLVSSEPNRKLLIVIGFILGMGAGTFIIFISLVKNWLVAFNQNRRD